MSRRRRELPWEAVDKEYVFEGPKGKQTLADLFDGRSQLIVYHFMFDPDWDEGCPSCSSWADNFDPNVVHLNARDVTLVAVSRAPVRDDRPVQGADGLERFSLGFIVPERLQLRLRSVVHHRSLPSGLIVDSSTAARSWAIRAS